MQRPGSSVIVTISCRILCLEGSLTNADLPSGPLNVGNAPATGVSSSSIWLKAIGRSLTLDNVEYTIVGDVVNVTQRLSDLNKEYSQYDLFLSAETFRLLGKDARVDAVHLGKVHVKGRAAPVDVYAVGRGVAGGT